MKTRRGNEVVRDRLEASMWFMKIKRTHLCCNTVLGETASTAAEALTIQLSTAGQGHDEGDGSQQEILSVIKISPSGKKMTFKMFKDATKKSFLDFQASKDRLVLLWSANEAGDFKWK